MTIHTEQSPARTCGERIPVTTLLRTRARAAGPDRPGTLRRSLVCELAEHTGEQDHWAVAQDFAGPQGGAQWAHWVDGADPVFTARADCPRTGAAAEGEVPCALFSQHPGGCSFEQSDRFRPLPGRESRILHHLGLLSQESGGAGPREAAAAEAALLLWDQLRSLRQWSTLPPWDQAAVYGLLGRANSVWARDPHGSGLLGSMAYVADLCGISTGAVRGGVSGDEAATLLADLHTLPELWQAAVLGGQREPEDLSRWGFFGLRAPDRAPRRPLPAALADATERSNRGEDPARPGPGDDLHTARQMEEERSNGALTLRRLEGLPYGWQVDAIRQITAGREALDVVSSAAPDINYITTYGIWEAHCAPHRPRLRRGER